MGEEPVWCAIGGFVEPGESHADAQVREAEEESGLYTVEARELGGKATNPNRAFFVADAAAKEGVHAYSLKIPFDWLVADGNSYKFKDTDPSVGFKKAQAVKFFPWRTAVRQTADALARSAVAQLLAQEL
jgi:ADP-ribose pyrophosphatase YjhB (NUDIX family)